MLYNGSRIGVFYKNPKWIDKWLDDFVEKIDPKSIKQIRKMYNHSFIIFLADGTIIQSAQANDTSRGCAFDKVYVEPEIDNEIVENVIRPLVKQMRIIIEKSQGDII